jgi:zinc protease
VAVADMLQGYKGKGQVAVGESFDPSPANIEARVARSQVGGLKLALLPKKTRGEMVSVSLNLRWGTEQAVMGRADAADMTGMMLMRGTTKHTRQQLKDAFDRLKARVSVNGSATGGSVYVEAKREHLAEVLTLVAEVLREPAFEAREFTLLREELLADIEADRSEPGTQGRLAWRRALSPYPRATRTTPPPPRRSSRA